MAAMVSKSKLMKLFSRKEPAPSVVSAIEPVNETVTPPAESTILPAKEWVKAMAQHDPDAVSKPKPSKPVDHLVAERRVTDDTGKITLSASWSDPVSGLDCLLYAFQMKGQSTPMISSLVVRQGDAPTGDPRRCTISARR